MNTQKGVLSCVWLTNCHKLCNQYRAQEAEDHDQPPRSASHIPFQVTIPVPRKLLS